MYDIIFISYGEPNAEKNWQELKSRFSRAKRVDGVQGIHQAHKKAAQMSFTKMFWVVDADAEIMPEFNFDYNTAYKEIDHGTVYVYRSRNAVNDLVYGYGGVKLLPKHLTKIVDVDTADMTTSITPKFVPLPEISNITKFNTDPFNTWKSAFRECTKLSSKIIRKQNNDETEHRLRIWTTVGHDKEYGEFAIQGACAGKQYGIENNNDPDKLKMINNFEWLKAQFDATC